MAISLSIVSFIMCQYASHMHMHAHIACHQSSVKVVISGKGASLHVYAY